MIVHSDPNFSPAVMVKSRKREKEGEKQDAGMFCQPSSIRAIWSLQSETQYAQGRIFCSVFCWSLFLS